MADPQGTVGGTTDPSKSELRRVMRALRRSLPDRSERSLAIWAHVRGIPAVQSAQRVMLFATVSGEPETASFVERCRAEGKEVAMPDDVDASWPDVVVVPGLAFTADGDRLGQGGGWYDRFLPSVRADCTTIGVGFAEQVLDDLPIEAHDVRLDHVVTDTGPATSRPF